MTRQIKNRIQNADNSSYFEAGGNVNNTVSSTGWFIIYRTKN